jgi:hypothetical protein
MVLMLISYLHKQIMALAGVDVDDVDDVVFVVVVPVDGPKHNDVSSSIDDAGLWLLLLILYLTMMMRVQRQKWSMRRGRP